MPLYVKRNNTGSLTIFPKGKRKFIHSGDLIECEPEDLGNKIVDFDEISPETTKKSKTNLNLLDSLTAKYQDRYRLKSWILGGPEWKAPIGSVVFTPHGDIIGMKAVLYDLEQRVEADKYALQEAWNHWKNAVKNDPMGEKKLSRPEGLQHIEPIAIATANYNHTQAEIAEIIKRIDALDIDGRNEVKQKQKRLFMKGVLRSNRQGQYCECDGYPIKYNKDGKPFIPDMNNKALKTYLEEVKVYRITQSSVKSAKIQQDRQEFLDSRKEKKVRAALKQEAKL